MKNSPLIEEMMISDLSQNFSLAASEMQRANNLVGRFPKTFHASVITPSTSFIKKVIVSGGWPHTYISNGSRALWK
jgi:hypothetical protein